MPLRAVIFDYGLVLSAPADPAAHAHMVKISGLAPEIFEIHYWRFRLDYDQGKLNGRSYWETLAKNTGLFLTPEQIDALIEQDIRMWASVDPVMLAWAARIQASGMKTAILSNMGEDLLAHMRRNFRWLDGFDHLTWSCELNLIKPQAAIYLHTVERLGVKPEEALFLDDRIENVEGARQVGLHALLFRTPALLQAELDQDGWASQLPPVIAPNALHGADHLASDRKQ
ncbi:MAG: HAD family phosphatase [Acidobacteriaceae bacterium]